jgi:hypothetical protein
MELGGCTGRYGALRSGYDFSGVDAITGNPIYTQCGDFWAGAASGGIGYITPSNSPGLPDGSGKIGLVCAMSLPKAIDDVTEYYMYQIYLYRTSSTGTTCPGCLDGVTFCANDLRLEQPSGSPGGDTWLGVNPGDQRCVTYNGGITPTHRTTWGSVKALYR